MSAAVLFFEDRRDLTNSLSVTLAHAPDLQAAITSGDRAKIDAALAAHVVAPLVAGFEDPAGTVIAGTLPTAPAYVRTQPITAADGTPAGTLVTGFELDAGVAVRLSSPAANVTVGFRSGQTLLAGTGARPIDLPLVVGAGSFDATVGGQAVRGLERQLPDVQPATSLVAVYPRAVLDQATSDVRRKVAIAIGFVLLSVLVLAELLVRAFTGQLGAFARRAREVGEGKFDGDLPVHGKDEFAQFARSFNAMAAELEQRIDELEGERRRVNEAVGRFGQALESSHDVPALLHIVIESAMEAVSARGGRVMIVDEQSGALVEHRRIGSATEATDETLPPRVVIGEGVEGLAAQTGRPAFQNVPAPVLSVPLQTTQAVIGMLTLIDPIRGPFSEGDGATLQALASQGAIAIENARMHRLITKQASTDGLTGLANHREFQDQLRLEVERAQRFALPLALILLDLDDFKAVNDRRGHLAGDSVLRSVAATLKACIREIDCAARYGGEEFAVILPGTTPEGAARLAERIRVTIGERPSAGADDRGFSVTASFGVAGLPGDGSTQVELIAAADAALYSAKGSGKNRVTIAGVTRP